MLICAFIATKNNICRCEAKQLNFNGGFLPFLILYQITIFFKFYFWIIYLNFCVTQIMSLLPKNIKDSHFLDFSFLGYAYYILLISLKQLTNIYYMWKFFIYLIIIFQIIEMEKFYGGSIVHFESKESFFYKQKKYFFK